MRNLFILILFSGVLSVSNAQKRADWTRLDSPVTSTLRNVFFTDHLNGWAAGADGIVIHTSNGGEDWIIQDTPVDFWISDIFFLDKNNGWAVTFKNVPPFNSIILRTTNGGNDWIAEEFPVPGVFMRTIYFLDTLNGFIGGQNMMRTSDGGISWLPVEIDSSLVSGLPVYKFAFVNEQFGYACGGFIDMAGVVWRTTNGGLNWTAAGISPDEIFDIYIKDSLTVVALSGDPEGFFGTGNIRTTDGGLTWTYEELPFYGLSFSISFRNQYEGWSASAHKLIVTTDGGYTWFEKETPDSSTILSVQFLDAQTGYAVGEEGVIYKFIPRAMSIDNDIPDVPKEFVLYQNFPNPFNPSTIIKYDLPVSANIEIKVYDFLGRKIKSLINNEYRSAGAHSITFYADNIPSGVYFYRLRTDNFTDYKKMLLIR